MKENLKNSNKWSPAAIALMNGGSVRTFYSTPWQNLTLENLYQMFPFGNTIEMIEISGKTLLQALEFSVADYNVEEALWKFLQVMSKNDFLVIKNGFRLEKKSIC